MHWWLRGDCVEEIRWGSTFRLISHIKGDPKAPANMTASQAAPVILPEIISSCQCLTYLPLRSLPNLPSGKELAQMRIQMRHVYTRMLEEEDLEIVIRRLRYEEEMRLEKRSNWGVLAPRDRAWLLSRLPHKRRVDRLSLRLAPRHLGVFFNPFCAIVSWFHALGTMHIFFWLGVGSSWPQWSLTSLGSSLPQFMIPGFSFLFSISMWIFIFC